MLELNLEKYAGKGETQLKSAGIAFSVTPPFRLEDAVVTNALFLSWRLFSFRVHVGDLHKDCSQFREKKHAQFMVLLLSAKQDQFA